MNDSTTEHINELYDNLSYFDMYFSSVLLFIFMTMVVILVFTYTSMMRNSEKIKQNWANEKCKPNVMPFAGFINKPDNETILEFTRKNFYSCVTNILSKNMEISMQPFNVTGLLDKAKQAYQGIDLSFNELNLDFINMEGIINNAINNIKTKVTNVMIPIQQIMYAMKDVFDRTQAVIVTGLYTSMGNSMLLKSMVEEMIKFIVNIFYSLVVIIVMMFAFPGLQGLAVAATAVVTTLSIIFIATNKSLAQMFHIKAGAMPRIPKCFDKNTTIKMHDGTNKPIQHIQVGDILENNNVVTATMKLDSSNVVMYNLNGILVSGSHQVFRGSKWEHVYSVDGAVEIEYGEPYIYCLNTTTKNIVIKDEIFLDWDEIYDEHLETIISNGSPYVKHKKDIHKYLDGGLHENTPVMMKDFTVKAIRDVKIGDVLLNEEIVYGLVEIKGDDLIQINKYNLGHTYFKGGPNLNMISGGNVYSIAFDSPVSFIKQINNPPKLYHLLTDKKTFYVGAVKMCDYNSLIDEIL